MTIKNILICLTCDHVPPALGRSLKLGPQLGFGLPGLGPCLVDLVS